MLFLREFCDTSSVLKVILFISELINIVRIVVPIGLIVMVSVDIAKNVISNNDSDMSKNVSIALKRVLMAIIIFFIPTIVDFANSLVLDLGDENITVSYLDCLENANEKYISKMEEEEKTEKDIEEANRKDQTVSDLETSDPYTGGGSSLSGTSLPEGEEYYPLDGKGEDGEQLDYLEVDGHYLSEAEMEELNDFIWDSVNSSSDWGTRVATAGWALAYGLSQKGLMLHYQKAGWANDSRTNNAIGSDGKCSERGYCNNWGRKLDGNSSGISSACAKYGGYINFIGDCSPREDYYYAGLDCTGFVKWAIRTGCGVTIGDSTYQSSFPRTVNYDEAQPGDVLIHPGHVILFLKKNDDGTYMTVESHSGGAKGLYFHKYSAESLRSSNYRVIRFTDEYADRCKVVTE